MDHEEMRTLMAEQLRLSRQLRERVRELEEERHAPLAVVGMGLRLPSALTSPDDYWDFLNTEGTALSGLPEERPGLRAVYDPVPGRPGRSYVERAGFLADIASFDAEFFGITHREAMLLDPQQRMLLETAWEALERAGIAARRADRLDVGVYLGMMASEYSERLEDRADTSRIDPYYTTGGGLCFGAGRISYVLGFSGPVMSVDTACSSSLSALHLAVRALRAGDCRYALVCGANLLLSANLMVSLSQTRALSPDGRSKSLLASADGYGRGEGVGTLVLMRLDEAEREQRPVHAVIRGTAVNHDGAASSLTAPSGPAQQEVIRAALDDSGRAAEEIGWVEAHGTGTVLGDPVEIGALDAVLGPAIRERGIPLQVGSVKSRLGHLEAASGIAAVLKTVLMLEHGAIPAAADEADGELNPHIPWEQLQFTVPRRNQPWPAELPRRVAGVNSFGMSGTNVHVVLENHVPSVPTPEPPPSDGGATPELLTLSARTPEALKELVADLTGRLRTLDADRLSSVCHTLRAGRVPFAHRLAVTGSSPTELAEALGTAVDGADRPGTTHSPPRSVTLHRTPDEDAVAPAVKALAARYPQLTAAATSQPGEQLTQIMREVGIRVALEQSEATAGDPAWLSWHTAHGTRRYPLVTDQPAHTPALLTEALAALFRDGADLRLAALRAPGARFTADLPTYPFQRTRYWIEEPAPHDPDTASTGRSAESRVPPPASASRADIAAYLAAELRDVLHAPEEFDPDQSFLDIGGDSFLFTLFISRVEEHFPLRLTPDDLPLDRPLSELTDTVADDIADLITSAEQEHTA